MTLRNATALVTATRRGGDPRRGSQDLEVRAVARHVIFCRLDAMAPADLCADPDFSEFDSHLDTPRGACDLTGETAAALHRAIARGGDGHWALAWCVMPSHVHVLIEETAATTLDGLVERWKAAALEAGMVLGSNGQSPWAEGQVFEVLYGEAQIARARRRIEHHGWDGATGAAEWSSAARPWSSPEQAALRAWLATPEPQAQACHVVLWLSDALPQGLERQVAKMPREVRLGHVDRPLDKARGRHTLAKGGVAAAVQAAILAGAPERYGLAAWCVMPTHLHVLLTGVTVDKLSGIVEGWRAETATVLAAARSFGLGGAAWAEAWAAATVQGDENIADARSYIEHNPVLASLTGSPQAWPWSSASPSLSTPPPAPQPVTAPAPDAPRWAPWARHVIICVEDAFPRGTVGRLEAAAPEDCFSIISQAVDVGQGSPFLALNSIRERLEFALDSGRDYEVIASFVAGTHVHVLLVETNAFRLEEAVEQWKAEVLDELRARRLQGPTIWAPGQFDKVLLRGREIELTRLAILGHRPSP